MGQGSRPTDFSHAAATVREKMASNDFLENAISSKIDEKSLTDLTNSLESSLPAPATISNQVATTGKSEVLGRKSNTVNTNISFKISAKFISNTRSSECLINRLLITSLCIIIQQSYICLLFNLYISQLTSIICWKAVHGRLKVL